MEPENSTTATTTDRRPILVALDGSHLAERALPWATYLAKAAGAPLVLVRVVPLTMYPAISLAGAAAYDLIASYEREEASRYLAQQAEALHVMVPDVEVRVEARLGDAAARLLDAEADLDAQMLVLTTHGRSGLDRWVRGSVAEKVLRHGAAPLLLIRPWDAPAGPLLQAAPVGKRVLVPIDGSYLADQAVPLAERLANQAQGDVVLLGVVPPKRETVAGYVLEMTPTEDRALAEEHLEAMARALRRRGVPVRTMVRVSDDVAQAIADAVAADGADLVAMSTHGRSTLGRWFYGSVADHVSHASRVPVLLFHPDPKTPPPAPEAAPAILDPLSLIGLRNT